MRTSKALLWSILLCLVHTIEVCAIVVGSDTAVSKNVFTAFPTGDPTNIIRGFASMNGGLSLQDSVTTCTFTSFFPVRKRFELNRGTFILDTDLTLENIEQLTNWGNIVAVPGEVRIVTLPSKLTTLGAIGTGPFTFENIELTLQSNVSLLSSCTFKGVCKVIGSGKVLDLDGGGELVVAPGSSLTLQNIIISDVQANKIRCVDNTGTIILSEMQWVQSADTYFNKGNILFNDRVTFMGTSTFSYESAYTSTINMDSEWILRNGITLSMGKHPVSQAQPLAFYDSTAYIVFDNCYLYVTNQGLTLTKGIAKFDSTVSFEFDSTTTSNGMIIGNNTPGEDFTIEFSPAAVLRSNRGHFTYNNSGPNGIVSRAKTSQLIRSASANVFVAQNMTLSRFTLENSSLFTPSIQVNAGKTLAFDDITIIVPPVQFDIVGQQFNIGTLSLLGNGLVSLLRGRMPLALRIQSTGNSIGGNGVYAGPIIFTTPTASATWLTNGKLDSSITLNNAVLTLGRDLFLDPSASLVGPGVINANMYRISYSPALTSISSPIEWINGKLLLNQNMSLLTTLTFSGSCEIDGNGYVLTLGSTAQLAIKPFSSLVLKNITINNLSSNKISCFDDTGSIIWSNTNCILDGDYTFTTGALQYKQMNKIVGNYVFAYQSQMTSTLFDNSMLILSQEITFSYDPIVPSKDLFTFVDKSSELILNRCTVHTSTVGINLKKGHMIVENDSIIESEIAYVPTSTQDDASLMLIDEGFTLGDGLNSDNDFFLQILSGITLHMTQGSLVVRNTDPQAWSFGNAVATLHLLSFTSLLAYEHVVLSDGRIIFEDQTTLGIVPGNIFQASISPFGSLQRLSLAP